MQEITLSPIRFTFSRVLLASLWLTSVIGMGLFFALSLRGSGEELRRDVRNGSDTSNRRGSTNGLQTGCVDKNLERATHFIELAVQRGAELVLLPELRPNGYQLTEVRGITPSRSCEEFTT